MTALAEKLRSVNVFQGETRVSGEDIVLTTVLGSCIATCLHDPVAKVGGLNHFLLAESDAHTDLRSMRRYGVYAMEVLINAMLEFGAGRARLRARLYGGAVMRADFRDIGQTNALFARRFLKDEKIALVGEDVGGSVARRVEFRPTLGLARCRHVSEDAGLPPLRPAVPNAAAGGDVLFF